MAAKGLISPTHRQREWTYRENTKWNMKGSNESLCFSSLLQINLGFGWFYFVQKEDCTGIDHVATLLLPKPGQFKV